MVIGSNNLLIGKAFPEGVKCKHHHSISQIRTLTLSIHLYLKSLDSCCHFVVFKC